MSLETVDRYLRKNGMMWLAKRRPKLTPEWAAKYLKWAKERENWMAENFEGIIGSDECSVEKSPSLGIQNTVRKVEN